MLYAILILRDCANRASLLARYGDVYDSVIWAGSVTLTATDTYLVVDFTLRCLGVEYDSILRAGVRTSTSHAATAEVSDIVVCTNAR
jgi:hypothetical protein